jgi:hypothetical protein
MEPIYERKISSEESKNGYFLVLKNKLLCFPSIGSPFSVKVGRREKKAAVESYHCECGGAAYHSKSATGKNLYCIRIEE